MTYKVWVVNDKIGKSELFSHDPILSNNSLIIFPYFSHVFSHAGDTLVSSDWSVDQSLARDYRYRHVFFYGSTCWLVGFIPPFNSSFEWKHFPVSMVCVDPVCPSRHQWWRHLVLLCHRGYDRWPLHKSFIWWSLWSSLHSFLLLCFLNLLDFDADTSSASMGRIT